MGHNIGNSMSHTVAIVGQVLLFSSKFCLQNEQLWIPIEHSETIVNDIGIPIHISSDTVSKGAEATQAI